MNKQTRITTRFTNPPSSELRVHVKTYDPITGGCIRYNGGARELKSIMSSLSQLGADMQTE